MLLKLQVKKYQCQLFYVISQLIKVYKLYQLIFFITVINTYIQSLFNNILFFLNNNLLLSLFNLNSNFLFLFCFFFWLINFNYLFVVLSTKVYYHHNRFSQKPAYPHCNKLGYIAIWVNGTHLWQTTTYYFAVLIAPFNSFKCIVVAISNEITFWNQMLILFY